MCRISGGDTTATNAFASARTPHHDRVMLALPDTPLRARGGQEAEQQRARGKKWATAHPYSFAIFLKLLKCAVAAPKSWSQAVRAHRVFTCMQWARTIRVEQITHTHALAHTHERARTRWLTLFAPSSCVRKVALRIRVRHALSKLKDLPRT